MKNFSQITLTGTDALDFAQRMFSRDFRALAIDEGTLALFLSAEGKIQSVFWACRTDNGLSLFMESSLAQPTFDLIERYHFAEKFVTARPSAINTSIKVSASARPSGVSTREQDRWVGSFRGLDFFFGGSNIQNNNADDEDLRIRHMIPSFGADFSNQSLVFDLGFEELCDPGKGCYIGQEVVERVRTRGGSGPKVFTLFEWSSPPPKAALICLSENAELVGQLSESLHGNLSLGFLKRGIKPTASSVFSVEGQPLIRGKVLRQIPNAL